MAGSREIRNKIKSVKNTQKITRAMEMVAASKMRKAQERMRKARPYGEKIRNVAAHMSRAYTEYRHPFLIERDSVKRVGIVVVTSDKGLCGGLNTNVLRLAVNRMKAWEQLLPLTDERLKSGDGPQGQRGVWDYIYEPEAKPVIDDIMVRYIEALIYQALTENMASEQSARMVAMKAASDNAGNVINELTLIYNKSRQAAITKELSEIVSGAAAV